MKKTLLFLSLCFMLTKVVAQDTVVTDSGKTQTETSATRSTGGDEKHINVYPNPSTGLVNLALSGFGSKKIELSVTNVIGNVVYRETLTDTDGFFTKTIDLTRYAKGIYYIKLETVKFSEMRKVVVK